MFKVLVVFIKINFFKIDEGISILGVKFNGLQVIFDGLFNVIQLPEDISETVVWVFVLFVDLYRLAIRLDGILVLVDSI